MIGSDFVLRLPALLLALVFHEYAHARVAYALGDPTPRYQGRLTLNPIRHLDPIGLLMLWIFRFGWAKPVQINPSYFKDPRRGLLLVSLAGPMMNILLAFAALLVLRLFFLSAGSVVGQFVILVVQFNAILAVFNLIPVPPLDGSKVLQGILPERQAWQFARLEPYGWVILLVLIWSGFIGSIMFPLMNGLIRFLDVTSRLIIGQAGI